MVSIVNYYERENKEGNSFFVLEVTGGIEMILSKTTDRYYATSKRAFLPCTFNEQTCKTLLGTQLSGTIEKQACEPYLHYVKETDEEVELNHRWVFVPELAEEKQERKATKDDFYTTVHSFNQSRPIGEVGYAN